MSSWTYVTGTFVVDVDCKGNRDNINKVNRILKELPKITGSEKNADYYVSLVKGHNVSEYFSNGKSKHIQTNVIITIHGCLRDRKKEETLKEVVNFIERLSRKLFINFASCTVEDYRGRYDCIGNWNLQENYVF